MESRPVAIENLIAELRRVETWLTGSLGVSVENPEQTEIHDPFSPPDDLLNLKHAIDRLRPLLWMFLTRQNEVRDMNRRKSPASVRSLMEDAMAISERYIGNGE
jgi:hypothetical protein